MGEPTTSTMRSNLEPLIPTCCLFFVAIAAVHQRWCCKDILGQAAHTGHVASYYIDSIAQAIAPSTQDPRRQDPRTHSSQAPSERCLDLGWHAPGRASDGR